MRSGTGLTDGVAQFAKFVVVGVINVAVGFAFFILFYRHFPPLTMIVGATGPYGGHAGAFLARMGISSLDAGIAYVLGAAAGMVTSFMLNKHWTFGAHGLTGPQLRRFVVLNVLNISASAAIISLLVDLAGVAYLPSWVAVTGLAMFVNFFANKYWTFATAPSAGWVATGTAPDGRS